jgi:hypothetical protein
VPFLLNLEKKYQNLAKNLKFLPKSPANKVGMGKLLHSVRCKELSELISDPDIKKAVQFYTKYHSEIGDTQDVYKMMFTLYCIKQTQNLEGNIIELGSYKGGNAIMMGWFLKQINSNRKVFACDTFAGILDDDEFVNNKIGKGLFSDTNFNFVLENIKKFKMDDNIELAKGKFQDQLDKKFQNSKFSLVFIDCNIYSSAKFAIEFTYPRLINDGIMIFHCYGARKPGANNNDIINSVWGETMAVKDFLKNKIEEVKIDSIPYIQKGKKKPTIINPLPKNEFSTYFEPSKA